MIEDIILFYILLKYLLDYMELLNKSKISYKGLELVHELKYYLQILRSAPNVWI